SDDRLSAAVRRRRRGDARGRAQAARAAGSPARRARRAADARRDRGEIPRQCRDRAARRPRRRRHRRGERARCRVESQGPDHRPGSQRILQRVMQELSANIKNVDVIHTSDAGHYVLLKEKKLLAKYTPAGVEGFPAGFKDKDGYYYGLRATVNAIFYNTKAMSAAEAPKTWKDLLDPKWKGKMVTAHPGYSGVIATHVLALVHLYGWDYFKALSQNKLMIVQ